MEDEVKKKLKKKNKTKMEDEAILLLEEGIKEIKKMKVLTQELRNKLGNVVVYNINQ